MTLMIVDTIITKTTTTATILYWSPLLCKMYVHYAKSKQKQVAIYLIGGYFFLAAHLRSQKIAVILEEDCRCGEWHYQQTDYSVVIKLQFEKLGKDVTAKVS